MFGTESADTLSRLVSITGLPILKRMIGIDFRPATAGSTASGTTPGST